jgi:hypothetical protein
MDSEIMARIVERPRLDIPPQSEVERFLHERQTGHGETAWVDEFNRSHTWADLLVGWTLAYTDRDKVEHWVRPGKDRRQGTSATVNYGGTDCLYVYTTSIPWLPSGRMYDKYGFMVHRDFGGDFTEAGRALGTQRAPLAGAADLLEAPKAEPSTRYALAEMPISSSDFWTVQDRGDDFVIAPFLGRGRAHALYAEAKAGKSYVVLQAVAAASIPHHSSWAEVPDEPVRVLYLDYEMTENDLRERLEIFGYGPADDYSHFHYVKASMLGADLDTHDGGMELLAAAQDWRCQLVIIDTMSRAVSGEENDADTVRKFYHHSGRVLKANDIAWLRLDHAGKARERGQRGSSAKNDDVDVVWQLKRTETGAILQLTHSRVFWMPQTIYLESEASTVDDSAVVHIRSERAGTPPGMADTVRRWLALGLAADTSRERARIAGLKIDNNLPFGQLQGCVRQELERREIAAMAGLEKGQTDVQTAQTDAQTKSV